MATRKYGEKSMSSRAPRHQKNAGRKTLPEMDRVSRSRSGFRLGAELGRRSLLVVVIAASFSASAEDAPHREGGAPATEREESATEDEGSVPALAPFTGPASGRPLPPPSQLAGMDFSAPGETSLEDVILQVQTEQLVETASKRAQKLNEVPMTVAWIPAEELEGTGQFSLCDAIQYFPGMECRRGPMRKVAISSRGLGSNFLSNRLLLLQDGRPQTDPWTGQFYGDETTPLTNVKQIEVIRGPGSSLYGSNAFSGVINIIRRSASDVIKDGRDYGADLRLLGGQHNTYRLQATTAARQGDLEGLVHYYGFSSEGAELFSDPSLGIEDRNQWTNTHHVEAKAGYKGLSLDADFTSSGIGRPGGTHISTVGNCGRCHYTPNDAEYVQQFNANAQFDHKVNNAFRFFVQAYTLFKRRTVDQENMITGELEPVLGKRNRVGGEARGLLTFGDLNVTFGGDAKNDTVNNLNILPEFNPDQMRQMVLGAFIDGEYRISERVIVSAGARYDHYDIPKEVWRANTSQLSPRASVVFHAVPNLVTLRTNYGRAFRAPTLSELAINQQMYASTLIGNPYLRAETLDTVEAAIDVWPAGGAVRLTGTGFYNNAKDFINQTFSIGSTSQFVNIGDARVVGFEVEAAAQVRSINSAFDIAYQYLDAQNVVDGRAVGRLDYAPNHRLYLRGRTHFGQIGFAELYAVYAGERFDPGFNVDPQTGEPTTRVKLAPYLVANARVGANVYKGLSASLLGANIFNTRYQEVHGFPANPLSLFAELKYVY